MQLSTLRLVSLICGSAFLGYCIYYDKKRRSHPDYKKKVLEKRKQQKRDKFLKEQIVVNFENPIEVQTFFLQELEIGERYLTENDINEAVEHLCRAIAVCPTPNQIILTLQQNIPEFVFTQILQKLPEVSRRIKRLNEPTIKIKKSDILMEDDVLE